MIRNAMEFEKGLIRRKVLELAPLDPEADIDSASDLALIESCMDLTSLNGDDTPDTVRRLCAQAESVAAVCVYPTFLEVAKRERVEGRLPARVRIATVAGAFPHGLSPMPSMLLEVAECARMGADEIDFVIPRFLALEGRWDELYDHVFQIRAAAGGKHLKAILATGELSDPTTIYNASITCLMAGSDFIKTSTGKERVNATLTAGQAMIAALKDFHLATGEERGLKAAGGIQEVIDAASWLQLVRKEWGEAKACPISFRIGASSLLQALRARAMFRT